MSFNPTARRRGVSALLREPIKETVEVTLGRDPETKHWLASGTFNREKLTGRGTCRGSALLSFWRQVTDRVVEGDKIQGFCEEATQAELLRGAGDLPLEAERQIKASFDNGTAPIFTVT